MPTWHQDPKVGSFTTVWETSLGHQEGYQEYCDWCLQGDSLCIQPIRDVLTTLNSEKSLCPFLVMFEYCVRCKSHFLPKVVTPLALTKTMSLSHQLLSLVSQLLHVQSLDSTTYVFSHALVVSCILVILIILVRVVALGYN